MKKYLLALPVCLLPVVSTAGFALTIDLDLFQGGLSILDSLFLIALGLTLIGILFLCIAFLKPEKAPVQGEMQEETELPEDDDAEEPEDESENEEAETAEAEMAEDPAPAETSPEEQEDAEGLKENEDAEPGEETEAEPEAEAESESEAEAESEIEPEPETETEPEPEKEPEEEKIYPKLTLTGINNNEFKVLPLKGEVTIGRRRTNDLVLSDSTISGVHCAVMAEDEKVYIIDKNSTNGTFINAKRIFEKTELHKGDVLALGYQEFRIGL